MYIIGIIANETQVSQIKKQMEKEKLDIEFVGIDYKSIENIKNIKFKILVIQENFEKLKENKEYIKNIIKNAKHILLNSDIDINEECFKELDLKLITYGLKHKSTITISGIEEDKVIISIQRTFKNVKNKNIDQKEVPVKVESSRGKNMYNSLIKMTIIELISGKNT